jgi:hypothetical protein
MAIEGLAAIGGVGVIDPVASQLGSKDELIRQSATTVLARMLEANGGAIKTSSAAMGKIKRALIQSAQDDSHFTRLGAVEGLKTFVQDNDQEVILLLERLSQGDSYAASQHGGDPSRYPVREAAKKALQSKAN